MLNVADNEVLFQIGIIEKLSIVHGSKSFKTHESCFSTQETNRNNMTKFIVTSCFSTKFNLNVRHS